MWNFFHFGSFVIQAINLAIIIWILRKFLFVPFLAYLEETEKKQQDIDDAAETIARIREESEKEANKVISDANAQAFQIRDRAKSVADDKAHKIVADAESQATLIKTQAQQDLDSAERKVRDKLQKEVLGIALDVNKKLFKEESKANKDFIKANI